MVETAQIALKAAIETVTDNVSPSKIGGVIENTIKNRGFKPIQNLTGHSVGRYLIHAGTSIPNVHQVTFGKLRAGEIYAIEPFVTVREAGRRQLKMLRRKPFFGLSKLSQPKALRQSSF